MSIFWSVQTFLWILQSLWLKIIELLGILNFLRKLEI